jgi:hypothetical protein
VSHEAIYGIIHLLVKCVQIFALTVEGVELGLCERRRMNIGHPGQRRYQPLNRLGRAVFFVALARSGVRPSNYFAIGGYDGTLASEVDLIASAPTRL